MEVTTTTKAPHPAPHTQTVERSNKEIKQKEEKRKKSGSTTRRKFNGPQKS